MNKLHTRWAEARLGAVAAMLALSLAACASTTEDIGDTGLGPRPELPSPQTSLLPTINIAPVQTRPSQSIPTAPPGFTVTAFASGLEHPRWVYPLPDGDLLVAESNAPAQHDEHAGIVGWVRKQVMKFVMKRAGAGVPSPDRIVLLRGQGGTAQSRSVLISGLHSPFGMALVGDSLYVADTDALLRFPYRAGDTQITTPGEKVADLPAGPINHHWTKECGGEPRRAASLCDGRLEQQRRGKRHRGRRGPRDDPRIHARDGALARVRSGPAQSERDGLAAGERRVVGRRQRTRRTGR